VVVGLKPYVTAMGSDVRERLLEGGERRSKLGGRPTGRRQRDRSAALIDMAVELERVLLLLRLWPVISYPVSCSAKRACGSVTERVLWKSVSQMIQDLTYE